MEEKTLVEATVVYPVRANGDVLLAKKTMKIGAGCWNGYGGGREAGESLTQAAVRELKEESGLIAREADLEKIALLHTVNQKSDGRVVSWDVYFYIARNCQGEPQGTEEMITPTWFSPSELPLDELMPADKLWVPMAIAGQKVVVTAYYGPFQKELLRPVEIKEVTELP